MNLTNDDLRTFARDGYVVVKGVVSEELLAAADEELDRLMAADPIPNDADWHMYVKAPSRLPACDAAVWNSDAISLGNQLVDPHTLDHALDHIQISLNVPGWSHIPGGPHIDCQAGDAPGSFTLLAAVYLCDESQPASGNLWVWPGSHHHHARLFAERGLDFLLATGGHAAVQGDPIPVLAERGDLLLAHFLLGHNRGGNETDRMRRIIYYRLATEGHDRRRRDFLVDPFLEFGPVRAALHG